jgi:hypothetical protein
VGACSVVTKVNADHSDRSNRMFYSLDLGRSSFPFCCWKSC